MSSCKIKEKQQNVRSKYQIVFALLFEKVIKTLHSYQDIEKDGRHSNDMHRTSMTLLTF